MKGDSISKPAINVLTDFNDQFFLLQFFHDADVDPTPNAASSVSNCITLFSN